MRQYVRWVMTLALSLLFSPVWSQTHAYRLDNGLLLLVRESHRAPVVIHQVWYRVGGSYEHWGITGISHLLEHMMFKGSTPSHPQGAFSAWVSRVGGQENAFTGEDFTCYWQKLSPHYLGRAMAFEADRMQNLRFTDSAFRKELEVVKEERRMRVDDQPSALLYERFSAIANAPGPYAHTVVGWPADLKRLTPQLGRRWYQDWYAPNNAIVVVVGDVNPESVARMARRHYGHLQRRSLPAHPIDRGHAPWGERHIKVRTATHVPTVMMGYSVPVLRTTSVPWQPWALALLSHAMDNRYGDGHLREALMLKQLVASSANAFFDFQARNQSQWLLLGSPAAGHTMTDLVAAFKAQVKRLQHEPIGDADLARFKRQAEADHVFSKDSIESQAFALGSLAAVGLPYQLADTWLVHIQGVTAAQLQAVAKQWLTPDRLTVAVAQVHAQPAVKTSRHKEHA